MARRSQFLKSFPVDVVHTLAASDFELLFAPQIGGAVAFLLYKESRLSAIVEFSTQ